MQDTNRAGSRRLEIYTDGSAKGSNGPGGHAFVARLYDGDVELAKQTGTGTSVETTNNREEAKAVIAALAYSAERHPGLPVTIFSDSQITVRGMTEWLPNWKRRGWRGSDGPVKNADLWKQIDAAMVGVDLTVVHVRGHAANSFNVEADRLAGEAMTGATFAAAFATTTITTDISTEGTAR